MSFISIDVRRNTNSLLDRRVIIKSMTFVIINRYIRVESPSGLTLKKVDIVKLKALETCLDRIEDMLAIFKDPISHFRFQ